MMYRTFLLLILLPSLAFSYSVVRKDGKTFTGELISQSEEQIILKDKDGVTLKFTRDQIDWDRTTEAIRKEEAAVKEKKALEIVPLSYEEREIGQRRSERKWTGEPISVDFKDIDVRDFFRFIAEISHMNLILDPAVKGTLTLKMVNVPWDQVLDVVCRNQGLGYTVEGNVVDVDKLR